MKIYGIKSKNPARNDRFNHRIGAIETIHIHDFLKRLWDGEIV